MQERKLAMVRQIVTTDRSLTEETRDKLATISSFDSWDGTSSQGDSPGRHLDSRCSCFQIHPFTAGIVKKSVISMMLRLGGIMGLKLKTNDDKEYKEKMITSAFELHPSWSSSVTHREWSDVISLKGEVNSRKQSLDLWCSRRL